MPLLAPIATAFATPRTNDRRIRTNSLFGFVAAADAGTSSRAAPPDLRAAPSSNAGGRSWQGDAPTSQNSHSSSSCRARRLYTDFDAVPDRAAIATVTGYWPQLGDEQIAEWVVAAIFENQYRLAQRAEAFRACAFASDAPSECASDSGATNHTMVSDLTVGVLGYGNSRPRSRGAPRSARRSWPSGAACPCRRRCRSKWLSRTTTGCTARRT